MNIHSIGIIWGIKEYFYIIIIIIIIKYKNITKLTI